MIVDFAVADDENRVSRIADGLRFCPIKKGQSGVRQSDLAVQVEPAFVPLRPTMDERPYHRGNSAAFALAAAPVPFACDAAHPGAPEGRLPDRTCRSERSSTASAYSRPAWVQG